MRSSWDLVPLGDVCNIVKNKHNGEIIPYIGLEHIESGTGNLAMQPKPTIVKSTTFLFNETHVLYGRLRPYLNKVFTPYFAGHCSTEIFPLECGSKLNRRFLFYWLTREETVQHINKTCTGARMPRANVKTILDFRIPLPPLPEQNRIVAILDEALTKQLPIPRGTLLMPVRCLRVILTGCFAERVRVGTRIHWMMFAA